MPRRPCRGGAGERARAGPDRRREAPSGPPSPFAISGGGNALLGKKVRFRGAVEPRFAGHTVLVQYLDPVTQAWTKQARTTVKPDGTFIARWKARRIGQFRMRALVGGEAQTASASPELPLTVFRPAIATWYGPGFYGNKTACGHRDDRGARRRRPPQPAVRDERRRALRVADARGPRRRPRPVQRRGEVGPHRRGRPAARLHAHGSHRRDPPRARRSGAPGSRSSGW